jgi:protein ImuA
MEGLAAVVAEIQELSFMTSRRLQLATEQSGVTGFMLRHYAAAQVIRAKAKPHTPWEGDNKLRQH